MFNATFDNVKVAIFSPDNVIFIIENTFVLSPQAHIISVVPDIIRIKFVNLRYG